MVMVNDSLCKHNQILASIQFLLIEAFLYFDFQKTDAFKMGENR